MRRKRLPSAGVVVCMFLAAVQTVWLTSCDRAEEGPASGELRLSFSEGWRHNTRSDIELPDTNDFILNVTDGAGAVIYSGAYGASPEVLHVPSGTCNVSVRSSEFRAPAFSFPVFGDDACVVVPDGGAVNVRLECRQVNAGIRLKISSDFLTSYPDGVLFVSSDDGRLMYGYSERRIAYFNPGNVSLVLSNAGVDKALLSRRLESQEILTLNVKVAGAPARDNISIEIDTVRIWTEEDYVIGGDDGNSGADPDNALSVNEARTSAGAEDVWVTGYVVGGDLSRSSMSFSPPFESATNLAIAARSSVTAKESCLSVELPSGKVRDALNLPAHPELLGRRIYLKGDIVDSYFGLSGIKNVNDFVVK